MMATGSASSAAASSSAALLPTVLVLALLFLLLPPASILRSATAAVDSDADGASCDGRRIHIRRLPSRFNADLLRNCSAYHPLYDDLCPFLANSGLGDKTHNRSRSWYRTDHRALEPLFHRRLLLEYPCLTRDPARADAIFLPYYAALDALRYLYGPEANSTADHGLELFDYLVQHDAARIWARRGGHDHFLVAARGAWDLSQKPDADPPIWGTSFLEIPEFFNVTVLTFESRAYPWQEQAIPYPTSFHPASLARLDGWLARARRSRRTTLMLFAGSGGSPTSNPNVRRSIREECENRTAPVCEFIDCSRGKCDHDPIRYMRPMLKSKFCLQPPGDTPTRRATFDGILAGCIPVFFEDLTAKSQYGWHLPPEEYGKFSVQIRKEDVVFGGVKIEDVLTAIPPSEVARMRERVLELAPRVIYRRHAASPGLRQRMDAFDIAVEGVLRRVKGRIGALQDGVDDALGLGMASRGFRSLVETR